MLSFKPTFSLSTFTFIKTLLSSSSLSAIRVVSSVYLRLLIFLPAILIPVCVSVHVWEIDGETVETVSDFIFGCSKITADDDCTHEIKRHLLLGRKVMAKLESILKSRNTTLPTKVHLVKAMVFPVVMYGCESWTVKKAECPRIDVLNCGVGEDS